MAHTVCKGNTQAYNAFKSIGYHTLNVTSVDEIKTLFSVLCGDLSIQEAVKLMPSTLALRTYASNHNQSSWQAAARWCEWWTRSRHLSMFAFCTPTISSLKYIHNAMYIIILVFTYMYCRRLFFFLEMLSSVACSMDTSTFSSLPSSTNAVESLHRIAKGKRPDVLKVALMSMYKTDMVATLEHIAASKNIPTSFERLTPLVRAQRAVVAHKARAKRMRDIDDGNSDGPPDKRSDFRKFMPIFFFSKLQA